MMNAFLLVPNHSLVLDGNTIMIEMAEADMLNSVRARFPVVGIAAFVTSKHNSSLAGTVDRSIVVLHRLNRVEHSAPSFGKLINYVSAILSLLLSLPRYDFLYIFCPGHCSLITALTAQLLGKRYGLYVRGVWPDSFWWRRAFKGASFMIVTGEAFRRQLLTHCEHVINEVPLTALRPADIEPGPVADRLSTQLLFAGQLISSKGVHDVIRAVAILRNEGRAVELAIAGGGNAHQIETLSHLCNELGVHESVRLLGHLPVEQLAEQYRRCGLFVFPSYYAEGFPRVLYEAMMHSLPIVTCEMPGTRGFLIDGENCLHCQPANPQDLAACLRRVLDDPELAARLGSYARRDVERLYDTFNEQSHARQLLRLLNGGD